MIEKFKEIIGKYNHKTFFINPFLFYLSSIMQGILFLILLIIFFNRNLVF